MANRLIFPAEQRFDANGDPYAGAKLYFYKNGTSTPKDTFTTSALTVAHSNPVIANADGTFPEIWLDGVYSWQLDDADDVQIDSGDDLTGFLSNNAPATFLKLVTFSAGLALDPEHATDSGTDAYVSATNTTPPGTGQTITRDFQSANTTPTPTLDGRTITDIAGNALWAGALNRVHAFLDDGTNYRVVVPKVITATATDRGLVELATSAEVSTGTDTGHAITPAGGEATYLKRAATSSDPALAFDTWRTPNANRPTHIEIETTTQTDGTTDGSILIEVDQGGGTAADYSLRASWVESNIGASSVHRNTVTFYVPAGGSYRILNNSDPSAANAISTHREFTL